MVNIDEYSIHGQVKLKNEDFNTLNFVAPSRKPKRP